MPHLASSVARIKASKCHIGLSTNAEVCEPSDSGLPGANVPNRELKNSRGGYTERPLASPDIGGARTVLAQAKMTCSC